MSVSAMSVSPMSVSPHWPLSGLRLRTPRLELRFPTPSDLDAFVDRTVEGIHDPDFMPFAMPWTEAPAEELPRRVLQYHWRAWGTWEPEDWTLNLAVVADGTVVGCQTIGATRFAVLREVHTGSWLGQRFQGRGIGTEMRAAVLHLAFAGLGARWATSAAFEDNAASHGVSRKLGYATDGVELHARRGQPATMVRLRLPRERWEARGGRADVRIEGLEPCLDLFGVPRGPAPAGADAPADAPAAAAD